MKDALTEKFRRGRPVAFTDEEVDFLRESLREAMGVTLERPPEEIADDAPVFDELGLDSVDVFDLLDQLGEKFEAGVELEELPEELIYGKEGLTFREFADAIIGFFRTPPDAATEK
jgi:acyl carrier protein